MAAVGHVALGTGRPVAADPAGRRWPEDRVDRCPLGRGREGPDDVQIHRPECRRPAGAESAGGCRHRNGFVCDRLFLGRPVGQVPGEEQAEQRQQRDPAEGQPEAVELRCAVIRRDGLGLIGREAGVRQELLDLRDRE